MKTKSSDKKSMLLSISALFLILLVAAGITFSWIEGGSSFVIQSDDANQTLKTGKLGDKYKYFDGLVIDPDSTTTLDLMSMDKNAGDAQELVFAQAYSSDGKDFYFPEDETDREPRAATPNDKGTKYINFSFNTLATKACFLSFDDENPLTITATKNGNLIDDTSAFRVMIECGNDDKILTTDSEQQTSTVYDSDGNKSTLIAKPASDYDYIDASTTNPLATYLANEEKEMTISIWLDAESATPELLSGEIEIDFQIKVAVKEYKVKFDAVTQTNAGVSTVSSFTGGSITVDGSKKTATYTGSYKQGKSFSATATPNTNYDFSGWYSNSACSAAVSELKAISFEVNGDAEYYAKFTEKPKYNISVVARAKNSTSSTMASGGGTVYVNASGTTTYSAYRDSSVKISATASSGYRFDGWYTNSDCTTTIGENYKAATQSVTVSAEKTYYAKFVKQYTVTLTSVTDGAISGTGGNAQIDSGTAAATVTKTVDVGTSVTLKGAANSGYDFEGIFDAQTGGTEITSAVSVTANKTYYARFTMKPVSTTTIYFDARGYSNYYAYIYKTSNGNEYTGAWPGDKATLDSTTGYYKYTFTTSDEGTFKVIVNNGSGTQYPSSGGLEGTIGGTYFFASGSPTALQTYNPVTVTLKAVTNGTVGSTGGTVQITGGTSGATSTKTVQSGTSVSLNATQKSGYTFDGFYTAATGGSKVTSPVTVTSSTTYYARFTTESTERTIYLKPNSNWKSSSARFAVYVWTGSTTEWYSMTKVNDNYYKVEIPKTYSNIIFVRMNGSTTANNWDNKWNQSVDLTIPTDGKNCYEVAENTWDKGGGTWSTYSP